MNKQFKECLNNLKNEDLDTLLGEISVMSCDDMVDDFERGERLYTLNVLMKGWYAVVNTDGIIAYFSEEKEAFRFRLDYINRIINN